MAESFPFYLPPEAKRLFVSEGVVRRVAMTAHWTNQVRVLELSGSGASLTLGKELGCEVTVCDRDETALRSIDERVRAAGLTGKVATEKVAQWGTLPFEEGQHDGILVLGRLLMPLDEAASKLRKVLAIRGRLVLTWPVRVGIRPSKAALEFWEKRIGTPLLSPRETLMAVEKHGYEPETIETPTDAEVDELYRSIEAALPKAPAEAQAQLQAELDMHKDHGVRSGVSYALMVLRREEPGERPPAARDGG